MAWKQALFVPMLNKVKYKANEAVPQRQLEYARGTDKRNEARSEIKRPASTKDGNEEVLQWKDLPYMAEKIRLFSLVCSLFLCKYNFFQIFNMNFIYFGLTYKI